MAESEVYKCREKILNRKEFIKKNLADLWRILLLAFFIACLFALGSFLFKKVFPPQTLYKSESTIYVEYIKGENEPVGWICYTKEAWHVFFASDDFEENVLARVEDLSKEQYRKCLEDLDLVLSDGRVLTLTIKDTDKERAKAVNEAMLEAIDLLGQTLDRIGFTRVLNAPGQAEEIIPEDRTLQVGLLAFLLSFLFLILGNSYRLLLQDDMYFTCPLGQKE